MTKEQFYSIASIDKFVNIVKNLDKDEADILKYKLSRLAVEELIDDYDLPLDSNSLKRLDMALKSLLSIQSYRDRVPKYGIAYIGRPSFMDENLLQALQSEAEELRKNAVVNFEQFIRCADTKNRTSVAEQLEENNELRALITKHAGAIVPSYISNYIYYDIPGHCSKPHVDNAFTVITVMIGLKHESVDGTLSSCSFSHWANSPRYDYQLKPGELAIFFGAAALHGRTPVKYGENVTSLLLSFRPMEEHK